MGSNNTEDAGDSLLTMERIFSDPDLGGTIPRALKLSPDGVRATFLRGRADDGNQMDLWEYNIKSAETRLLVDSTKLLSGQGEEVSEEEQARRERERIASMKGIVSYIYSDDGYYILFPLSGDLYTYCVATSKVLKLTSGEGFATDPNFSPNGRYVSYVRDRNLFVYDMATSTTRQITTEGAGPIAWGMAEFVAQEEMDRMTGYWWAPNDAYLVAARIDETPVPLAKRFEIHQASTTVAEQRYPAAGEKNVLIKLAVLDPLGEKEMKWLNLGEEEDIYVARVNWLNDGSGVLVQRLSRDQHQMDVLLFRLIDATTLQPTTIIQEQSSTWVNIHNNLSTVCHERILWASEKTGYNHLYLHNIDGSLIRPLTSGKWAVDTVLGVDRTSSIVYFTGNRECALEKHLYSVSLEGGEVKRITQEVGWHEVTLDKSCSVYFDTWSDAHTPPQ
eukprot:Ihof_evm7s253 gene=Ihof_evmTU7s253